MEKILCSAELSKNEITGPSMKAFMYDVILVEESRSNMEQLVTNRQKHFEWAVMKNKALKMPQFINDYRRLQIDKVVHLWERNPPPPKKASRASVACYSLPLTDQHSWQDLSKLLKDRLRSIDKCDLPNKDKVWGGARGVMVIVVGNGHGDSSSNPGRDWLHFT